MNGSAGLVAKLWNYCNVLRDDGLSYGDYVEHLTYLLFLKMADERTRAPYNRPAIVPSGLDWPSLIERDGDALEVQYRHVLTELGRRSGMLGVIFLKAQSHIQYLLAALAEFSEVAASLSTLGGSDAGSG